jgi:hypothetical protein
MHNKSRIDKLLLPGVNFLYVHQYISKLGFGIEPYSFVGTRAIFASIVGANMAEALPAGKGSRSAATTILVMPVMRVYSHPIPQKCEGGSVGLKSRMGTAQGLGAGV